MSDLFEKRFCSITGKKQSLEDMLEFPVDHGFKIIGLSDKLIIESVVKKIEKITGKPVNQGLITQNKSSKGKYSSYTVRVFVETAELLKDIYKMLEEDKTIAYKM